MADVDIVIVNYKSAAHTVNCVGSVRQVARKDNVNVHIVVVDNGDDEADLEKQLVEGEDLRVLKNDENYGFAVACNKGASLGHASSILFLNPDALLHDGALKGLTSFLAHSGSKHIGIVGPEILDANGNLVPSCSNLPTALNLVLRSTGIHTLVYGLGGDPYLPLSDHQSGGPVGQVMGAVLMIRRSLFEALEGFDEDFFVYYEDVDLCARAMASGSTCYYQKDSTATHVGRASSSQDSGFSLALHIRSRITYARRHFGLTTATLLALVCGVVELPARFFVALFGRGALSLSAVARAYALLLQNAIIGRGLPAPGSGVKKWR